MIKKKNTESVLDGILKYSISTWINLVVGFLSVIITTRILAPDAYGYVTLFLSASSFLMYILTFGMDGAYIRFYNEQPQDNSKSQLLYKLVAFSTIICLIAGGIVTVYAFRPFSFFVFGYDDQFLVGILFLYTFCQAILRFLNISFRMGFKTKQYNIQNILINCSARMLIIFSALFTGNHKYILAVMSVGIFVILLFYLYKQRNEIYPVNCKRVADYSLSLKGYADFFRFAVFSAPTYFVAYFNTFISQRIIRNSIGAYGLGIYSSCGMFGTIFGAVQGGFATYWSAYIYKNHSDSKEKIARIHDYILVFTIFSISGLIIMRDIVYLMIGKEYHSSKTIFSVLLISSALNFIRETTDKGIAIAKKNEFTLISHVASVLVNIIGCFLLIKPFGIIGAAYANGISAIVLYVLMTVFAQKYYKTITSVKKSVLGVAFIVLIMVFPSFVFDLKLIIGFVLSVDLLSLLIFYKEVKEMIKMMMSYILIKKKNLQ